MTLPLEIEQLTYEQLDDLIRKAEEMRAHRREQMRADLERQAELIGLSVRENGKAPRKKRASSKQNAET
jgi:hypothetical protein